MVIVKHMNSRDLKEVLALMIEFEESNNSKEFGPQSVGKFAAIIRTYLRMSEGLFLVATSGRRVLGYLFGHAKRKYKSDFNYHHFKLVELYVTPSMRKLGVGQRLLDTCIRELKRMGIGRVYIDVEYHDRHAMAFWKKQGFKKAWLGMEREF